MQIGELKVRLGVDADTFKIKDFAHALGQIPFSVAAGITALTGMSFAITDLLKDTLGLADNLRIFTSITGQSGTELERWTSVAKQLGLDANSVQGSVMGLVKTFSQFKITGSLPENFLLGLGKLGMGFDPNKNPFQFMREALAKANRSGAIGAEALSMMGIDPTLMQMGALSQKQFNKMAMVTLDDQGIQAMKDFREALGKFELTITKALTGPLVEITPILGQLATVMADFIKTFGPALVHSVGAGLSVISGIKKKGFEKYFDDLQEKYLPPNDRELRMRADALHMSVTNNIHSTADPEAVAEVVNQFTARYHRKAVSAFNNGGR